MASQRLRAKLLEIYFFVFVFLRGYDFQSNKYKKRDVHGSIVEISSAQYTSNNLMTSRVKADSFHGIGVNLPFFSLGFRMKKEKKNFLVTLYFFPIEISSLACWQYSRITHYKLLASTYGHFYTVVTQFFD